MIGTTLEPLTFDVLKVETGIGTRSPIRSCAFWPSAIRSCGLARSSASLLSLMNVSTTEGIVKPKDLIPICWSWSHVNPFATVAPRLVTPVPGDGIVAPTARGTSWMPRFCALVVLICRSSTSTTTSATCLSFCWTMRSATATLSEVSRSVIEFSALLTEMRVVCRSARRALATSVTSAFERKNVRMTRSS